MQGPGLPIMTDTVMNLGARARRLAWGYFIYVLYYLGIGGLVFYYGVKPSGLTQIAQDIVRLSGVLVPLTGYIAANVVLGTSLRYIVPMHRAGRWLIAALSILMALIALGIYAKGLWRWYEAGFPRVLLKSQLFGLVLASGYVLLAYAVVRTAVALHRFVLIDGVWLPKLEPR